MELSDLTAYAEKKHGIQEQRKWDGFPGFSVLCDPMTGKWAALLMRQWDSQRGEEIQRADIKCGRQVLAETNAAYLSLPFRMKGVQWVGVSFGDETDPQTVFRMFDTAIGVDTRQGYTFVLDAAAPNEGTAYTDVALPFAPAACGTRTTPWRATPGANRAAATRGLGDASAAPEPAVQVEPGGRHPTQLAFGLSEATYDVPERIRQMIDLYEYGSASAELRARNFYRQGVFMADYTDDAPWQGAFHRYYTTYHDLNVRQLRGYFTWRTQVRNGDWRPIATSLAYMYMYELLNGIGADSPQDALAKMGAFAAGFVDSGVGDPRMKTNVRRWMLEYAVLHGVPVETARHCADPAMLERDDALVVLRAPDQHDDDAVFEAFCLFAGAKLAASPVVAKHGGFGRSLFAETWRGLARRHTDAVGRGIFSICFGEPRSYRWHPLSNAVVHMADPFPDADYALDECRSYRCRDGVWTETCYEQLFFNAECVRAIAHEADRYFRRMLKTGHYLREKPSETWVRPYAEAAVGALRRKQHEMAKREVDIDFAGIERIRHDAAVTRDRLLVDEDELPRAASLLHESSQPAAGQASSGPAPEQVRPVSEPALAAIAAETKPTPGMAAELAAAGAMQALPGLDELHTGILRELLAGGTAADTMASLRLMPTVVADTINGVLFDEIGDSVVECDGDTIRLVDEYRQDVASLWEGSR
ncbi:MAG: TerB N-terminal domain-containing protein [Actinomycetota bacterium]|nr:TerB N-terminal domain-containing protein [Actinomycetota bacterium]